MAPAAIAGAARALPMLGRFAPSIGSLLTGGNNDSGTEAAKAVLQRSVVLLGISWVGFSVYGYFLARGGEPQKERVYDTGSAGWGIGEIFDTGDQSNGGAGSGGDLTDKSGDPKAWINDGLEAAKKYVDVTNSPTNRNALYRMAQQESSLNPNAVQQIQDINSNMPGAGGFPNNKARGFIQVTPQTWQAFAPKAFKPASKFIFKPRVNVMVSVIYQIRKYGRIVGHGGY